MKNRNVVTIEDNKGNVLATSAENQNKDGKVKVYKSSAWPTVIVGGVCIAVGVVAGIMFKSCENQNLSSVDTDINEEQSYTIDVENAVQYISYDEIVSACGEIGKDYQTKGYDNVSQRSINALYVLTNSTYIADETMDQLVENGVISQTPMDMIIDSLEFLSVCQDQCCKAITDNNKDMFDLTNFCSTEKDKKLVQAGLNTLNNVKKNDNISSVKDENEYVITVDRVDNFEEVMKNNCDEFDNFYKFMTNQEDTTYPGVYNEYNEGVLYLLGQGYGGAICQAGAYNGISQEKVVFLEENTGMNDFSTLVRRLEARCLVADAKEETKTLTK